MKARAKNGTEEVTNTKDGEEGDENEDLDMYEDDWDSEGLEGDEELKANGQDDDKATSG